MTVQELKEKKKELGYTNAQLAKISGVPLGTVQKIFGGATASPRRETLLALERVLGNIYSFAAPALILRESQAAYLAKKQGEYTLADYYQLPEDQRVELIDGVIYVMEAPSSAHQLAAGYIHAKFFEFVAARKGNCLPMIAPVDVQLDRDDRTMVEPDVLIVCDRDIVLNRCVYGAPDFVLEVLSKSTRKKDMITKLAKYQNAGVKEYWLIDLEGKRALVYDFASEKYPAIYGFDARIPVGIWDGECEIDLAELNEQIRFLEERDS